MNNYIVAWVVTEDNFPSVKHWEIISGEDAAQIRVSELVDGGIDEEDVVLGVMVQDE